MSKKTNYEGLNYQQLKKLLAENKIEGRSKLTTKGDMIVALKALERKSRRGPRSPGRKPQCKANPELEKLPVKELRKLLTARNFEGRSKLKSKAEMVDVLCKFADLEIPKYEKKTRAKTSPRSFMSQRTTIPRKVDDVFANLYQLHDVTKVDREAQGLTKRLVDYLVANYDERQLPRLYKEADVLSGRKNLTGERDVRAYIKENFSDLNKGAAETAALLVHAFFRNLALGLGGKKEVTAEDVYRQVASDRELEEFFSPVLEEKSRRAGLKQVRSYLKTEDKSGFEKSPPMGSVRRYLGY